MLRTVIDVYYRKYYQDLMEIKVCGENQIKLTDEYCHFIDSEDETKTNLETDNVGTDKSEKQAKEDINKDDRVNAASSATINEQCLVCNHEEQNDKADASANVKISTYSKCEEPSKSNVEIVISGDQVISMRLPNHLLNCIKDKTNFEDNIDLQKPNIILYTNCENIVAAKINNVFKNWSVIHLTSREKNVNFEDSQSFAVDDIHVVTVTEATANSTESLLSKSSMPACAQLSDSKDCEKRDPSLENTLLLNQELPISIKKITDAKELQEIQISNIKLPVTFLPFKLENPSSTASELNDSTADNADSAEILTAEHYIKRDPRILKSFILLNKTEFSSDKLRNRIRLKRKFRSEKLMYECSI